MNRLCWVLPELFPVTPGGIGRLAFNLYHQSAEKISLDIVWTGPAAFRDKLKIAFPKVTFHFLQEDPRGSPSGPLEKSVQIFKILRELETGGKVFECVEFCDFEGLAYYSLQQKKLGAGLHQTPIVVRLHSTFGLVNFFDQTLGDPWIGRVFDMERLALLEADLVVGHLGSVCQANKEFYGFSDEWQKRVRIEFPPILGPDYFEFVKEKNLPQSDGKARRTDFVFPSKFQKIKQPDLYFEAALSFLKQNPKFNGRFIFACRNPNSIFEKLRDEFIPIRYRGFFEVRDLDFGDRLELFSKSIVVVPSSYESLGLVAYEALFAGGRLILNAQCPAFSDDSVFIDGKNCLKFQGSAESLAQKMQAALNIILPTVTTKPPQSAPYWEDSGFLQDLKQRTENLYQESLTLSVGSTKINISNMSSADALVCASLDQVKEHQQRPVLIGDAKVLPFWTQNPEFLMVAIRKQKALTLEPTFQMLNDLSEDFLFSREPLEFANDLRWAFLCVDSSGQPSGRHPESGQADKKIRIKKLKEKLNIAVNGSGILPYRKAGLNFLGSFVFPKNFLLRLRFQKNRVIGKLRRTFGQWGIL